MSGADPGWHGILAPGERILWQGRPGPGVIFAGLVPRRVMMGLAMCLFAAVWTLGASRAVSDAPLLPRVAFPLAGLFFLFQGARMAGADRLWQAWLRQHSWYSLSNRRAFIAWEVWGRRGLRDWPIDASCALDFTAGPPASVYFARTRTRFGRSNRIGFERIEDGRAVLELMRQIQTGAV